MLIFTCTKSSQVVFANANMVILYTQDHTTVDVQIVECTNTVIICTANNIIIMWWTLQLKIETHNAVINYASVYNAEQ